MSRAQAEMMNGHGLMGQLARHHGAYPTTVKILSAISKAEHQQERNLAQKKKPVLNAKTKGGKIRNAGGGANIYSLHFDKGYLREAQQLADSELRQRKSCSCCRPISLRGRLTQIVCWPTVQNRGQDLARMSAANATKQQHLSFLEDCIEITHYDDRSVAVCT